MKLTVIGCGDAFGSGGRLQTCFHVDPGPRAKTGRGAGAFLVDCGVTALIGHQRAGLDPAAVRTILVTHLHGDHFGGLVWWTLHAIHVERRTAPLDIAGPVGIEARFRLAFDAFFPGALHRKLPFEIRFHEQVAGRRDTLAGLTVTPYEVSHPSGAPSHALRIEVDGVTLAYSGDTEWVENLVPCATEADLFICECFAYDAPVPAHLDWQRLSKELPRISARRVMLTHMGEPMLAKAATARQAGVLVAEDGMTIDL